jgi:ATP-dependent Clp protease ATP-binding subunit ClpA
MIRFTDRAGIVPELGRREAERLHQYYIGPEHLLLGLLVGADNSAARLLHAHGLDVETVRAEVDRLVAQGRLPGPRPSDAELLATLGIDLEAVHRRLEEAFGHQAFHDAAQRVRHRARQPVAHTPMGGTPLACRRVLVMAAREAMARHDQWVGPLHLLLGLLRDAEDPLGTDLYPEERRRNAYLGLPTSGPHPVRLLVEARGLTLEALKAAVLRKLDRGR